MGRATDHIPVRAIIQVPRVDWKEREKRRADNKSMCRSRLTRDEKSRAFVKGVNEEVRGEGGGMEEENG